MLSMTKDIDSLVHIILGTLAQGEDFYESQKQELINFFGAEEFQKAEDLLKETRLFNMLFSHND